MTSWFTDATVLRIIDSLAIVFAQAYQLARMRLSSNSSPVLRIVAQRDQMAWEVEIMRRDFAVLQGQRESMPAHRRPTFSPEQRLEILQIMRLQNWNAKRIADRFILHVNTVRQWVKAVDGRCESSTLLDVPRWNRIDDAVRWAVHELRRLCPAPEFGTRTMARHLVRSGIQISRSSVQRMLRENKPIKPRKPRAPMVAAMGAESHHLLAPTTCNEVWHVDLTTLRLLWWKFTIAAMMDGFSRKLFILKVYSGAAKSRDMIQLMRDAVLQFGQPRFIITDHGCQFRKQFKHAVEAMGITQVKGRIRQPNFNGKVERIFRTLRQWLRFVLLPSNEQAIQRRLDIWKTWYNTMRPHSSLGYLTPQEVWQNIEPPVPIPIRTRGDLQPVINVKRSHCQGDPRLPVVKIDVNLAA